MPSLARHASEHARGVAVDGHHHVVERRVGSIGHDAPRLVGRVLRRVPALARQVDAAAERDGVVDHDELLVMRPTGRVRVVELHADAPVRLPPPTEPHGARRLPIGRIDHREIPVEHVDVQVAPAAREVVEVGPEPGPGAVVLARKVDAAIAVEVPRQDEDGVRGELRRAHERPEIVVAVDDERDAIGVGDPAAVPALDEEASFRHRNAPARAISRGAACRAGRRTSA
jgi:hypothetical protein